MRLVANVILDYRIAVLTHPLAGSDVSMLGVTQSCEKEALKKKRSFSLQGRPPSLRVSDDVSHSFQLCLGLEVAVGVGEPRYRQGKRKKYMKTFLVGNLRGDHAWSEKGKVGPDARNTCCCHGQHKHA